MRKGFVLVGVIALSLAIEIGIWFTFFNEDSFEEGSAAKIEKLEEPVVQDKVLSASVSEKGRFIYSGSPYNFNEVIYIQGVGIEVSKGKIFTNPLELEGLEKQKYATFNIRVLNYNEYDYEVKSSDIIFTHTKSEGEIQEQDMLASGYEKWKYFTGSFQFGKIKKNTVRSGIIYTPISERGLDKGELTIYINNVPVTFKY